MTNIQHSYSTNQAQSYIQDSLSYQGVVTKSHNLLVYKQNPANQCIENNLNNLKKRLSENKPDNTLYSTHGKRAALIEPPFYLLSTIPMVINMPSIYHTSQQNQAQQYTNCEASYQDVVTEQPNSLKSLRKPRKNNITFLNQQQRLKLLNRDSKPNFKKYCIQVFFYSHIGIDNSKEYGRQEICNWIADVYNIEISIRSLVDYIRELKEDGYIESEQTAYRNEEGFLVSGHNKYTLLTVDPLVHAWLEDKPLLPVRRNEAHTLNRKTKSLSITNSMTNSFSEKGNLEVEDVKPKPKMRPKDPNMIVSCDQYCPSGKEAAFFLQEIGTAANLYDYLGEYQSWQTLRYPNGAPRKQLNYEFYAFTKQTKALKEKYQVNYIPASLRRTHNSEVIKTIDVSPQTYCRLKPLDAIRPKDVANSSPNMQYKAIDTYKEREMRFRPTEERIARMKKRYEETGYKDFSECWGEITSDIFNNWTPPSQREVEPLSEECEALLAKFKRMLS